MAKYLIVSHETIKIGVKDILIVVFAIVLLTIISEYVLSKLVNNLI